MKTFNQLRFLAPMFFICLVNSNSQGDEKMDLETIAYRSIANQSSFKTYVCQFVFTTGSADSIDELAAGRFSHITGVARGRWAKDGERELFTSDVDAVFEKQFYLTPEGEQRAIIPFSGGEKFVSNDRFIAVFRDIVAVAEIDDNLKMTDKIMHQSPWTCLGTVSNSASAVPGYHLLQHRDLKPPFASAISEKLDCVNVLIDLGDYRKQIVFSRSNNFLAMEFRFFLGKDFSEKGSVFKVVDTLDLVDVGSFPKTAITISNEAEDGKIVVGSRFDVLDFEYRKPNSSELSFSTRGHYQLRGSTAKGDEIVIPQGFNVNPDSLANLRQSVVTGQKLSLVMPVPVPKIVPSQWYFGAVSLSAIMVFLVFWLKGRRVSEK